MPKNLTTKAKTPVANLWNSGAAPGLDPAAIAESNDRLLNSQVKAHADGFDRAVRMGQEYLTFVCNRLERDRA